MKNTSGRDAVLRAIEDARDEMVAFAQDLIRIPTVNPPGDCYEPCAQLLGAALARDGFHVEYVTAVDRPEHSARFPRVNVVGRKGAAARPCIHLNGHIDVVPVGEGWSHDPFAGTVEDGRLYGRGASDMKGGIAAARFAVEGIRRAGIPLAGTVEISGTVDEESGGWAGVAHLAAAGRLTSDHVDQVVIPEPLGVDQVCIGHRGVYWFELTTKGRIAHGSMPFLGVSAIEHMGEVLHHMRAALGPALARRITAMPVIPAGARQATLNVNSVWGGQPVHGMQTPCVADRCTAVFDRRFLVEESVSDVKREVQDVLNEIRQRLPAFDCDLRELMLVHPVATPTDSPLVASLARAIGTVRGTPAGLVASPGTYDHKHVTRIGGIVNCVAYGPGRLELSHQPDEWCDISEMVQAAQVMALGILDVVGPYELRGTEA
ncbi:MAG: acetylornithine deacetylase/succinyl-diaminopimelate desuccinylase family protein [Gemmatimonadaceae bacterium]